MICIGKIIKAHGIRGEIKIETYTESPLFFLKKGLVLYTVDRTELLLLHPRISRNFIISKINKFSSEEFIEKYKNTNLYIKELPIINEPNTYYFEDLKGMKVIDSNKNEIGFTTNVCDYGAGVFLEIKFINRKEATIPFDNNSILEILLEQKVIIIDKDKLLV